MVKLGWSMYPSATTFLLYTQETKIRTQSARLQKSRVLKRVPQPNDILALIKTSNFFIDKTDIPATYNLIQYSLK